ncbi:MAG: hypothetical protein KF778_02545 [Rhodocyclaceae bacterium]|nr:hypothetical protein [Rhodocyclaceae bacterium]MBX3667255.1 hypothetical protein [Rhodocyclaceae bacterium]
MVQAYTAWAGCGASDALADAKHGSALVPRRILARSEQFGLPDDTPFDFARYAYAWANHKFHRSRPIIEISAIHWQFCMTYPPYIARQTAGAAESWRQYGFRYRFWANEAAGAALAKKRRFLTLAAQSCLSAQAGWYVHGHSFFVSNIFTQTRTSEIHQYIFQLLVVLAQHLQYA